MSWIARIELSIYCKLCRGRPGKQHPYIPHETSTIYADFLQDCSLEFAKPVAPSRPNQTVQGSILSVLSVRCCIRGCKTPQKHRSARVVEPGHEEGANCLFPSLIIWIICSWDISSVPTPGAGNEAHHKQWTADPWTLLAPWCCSLQITP